MSRIIALFAVLFAVLFVAPIAMVQDAIPQEVVGQKDVAAAPATTQLTPEEHRRMEKLQGDLTWAKEQMESYLNDVAEYCDKPYKDSEKTAADKALLAACIERHDKGYQLKNLSEFIQATDNQLAPLKAKLNASQAVQNEETVEPPIRYEDDRDIRELSNGYNIE